MNLALAVAIQLAAVIGQRRANARRRANTIHAAGFTIAPGSYLAHALAGRHGPECQRAAQRELADLRAWEKQWGAA